MTTRKELIAAFLDLPEKDQDEILKHFNNARTSEVSSAQTGPVPVMKDGKLHNFMLRVDGVPYRCKCGCNVFHKPDDRQLDMYRCNSCDETFLTE